MFEFINFVVTQLQRLKKAMQQAVLAGFTPDGKTVTDVSGYLSEIGSTKGNVVALEVGLNTARGAQYSAAAAVHEMCVNAYAAMRSVYRANAAQLRAIRRIPKKSFTPRQTLTRADVTAGVWAQLPDMPGTNPPAPFTVGSLTLAALTTAIADLRTKVETCEGCDSLFEVADGGLTERARELGRFVSAAVAQGRARYAPGTVARDWIDTIPLAPGTVAPLQAVIAVAASPAPGVAELAFSATHATSYTVLHRLAPETEFTPVATDVTEEFYAATNLPAGDHEYRVVGHNSRGDGPASETSTVPVAGAVPEQAFITAIESPEAGAVALYYEAAGATSFQVWHKGPGESQFAQVDATVTGEYTAFSLPGGMHAYQIVGVNAVGTGAASEPSTIDVAQAQAA